MLRAHYEAPNRTLSWAELAHRVGYDSWATINLLYGKFAHRVADALGVEEPPLSEYYPDGFWGHVLSDWAPAEIDPVLTGIVGPGPLSVGEITRRLWEHIQQTKLQDPLEPTVIHADEKLLPLFDGAATMDMTTMIEAVNSRIRRDPGDRSGHTRFTLRHPVAAAIRRLGWF